MNRHPPMQPGWIDRLHQRVRLGTFELESGECIDDLELSFVVHGDFENHARPIVLGLCAIGSSHHRLDFLIGPERAFDPARCTVIVVDAIGNGLSTSPSNSLTQPGRRFPRFTIRDMVRSQRALLKLLGVDHVDCVAGASMGGMQALQWGVLYPDFMRDIVAMTPMAKTASWAAAMNHAGRLCLEGHESGRAEGAPEALFETSLDTSYGVASDRHDRRWEAWVAVMQVFAMRTPARFARDVPEAADVAAWLAARTAWWVTQAFDPIDWIYQSWAYDAHDVGTTPGFAGDTDAALRAIRARTQICTPVLDLYNPVDAAEQAARIIPGCEYLKFDADSGHLMATDADPVSARRLNSEIRRFTAF